MAKKNETTVTKTKRKRSNPLAAPSEADHLLEWIAPQEDVTVNPEPEVATANLTQSDVDAAEAKREAEYRVILRADITAVIVDTAARMPSPLQGDYALATTDKLAGLMPRNGWMDFDENQKPIASVPIEAMRNAYTNSFDEALVSASQALREIGLLSRWSAVKIEKILDRVEQAVCCGDVATYDRLTGFRYARDEQTLGMILTTRGDVDDWCKENVAGFISTTPRELPANVMEERYPVIALNPAQAEILTVNNPVEFDSDGFPEYAPSAEKPAIPHQLMKAIWVARAMCADPNLPAEVYAYLRIIAQNQSQRKFLIQLSAEGQIMYVNNTNNKNTNFTIEALQKMISEKGKAKPIPRRWGRNSN